MKQILQDLRSGTTMLAEVPSPVLKPGHLLIRTHQTLVSSGTERMLVDFGKASILEKAKQHPDKVKMVVDKIKTDGLTPTLKAVNNKLDKPVALGYCNVGQVVAVGDGCQGFSVGDRVVSNGNHAEVVCVPKHLCAKIPSDVSDEKAVFTVLGAIALQGIRLVQPTLGESIVVYGLGVIGLLTVQLLKANGCQVLGIDLDPHKLALAEKFGAKTCDLSASGDPVKAGLMLSRSQGVDGVIITASSKSHQIIQHSAQMSRKRGRIVLVGVVGLNLSRADFYEKELSFQVSCSYGPGRYDPEYELKGQDYPLGFVRWTQQRNFEAILELMRDDGLAFNSLISHRIAIQNSEKAYTILSNDQTVLGIVLTYPDETEQGLAQLLSQSVVLHQAKPSDRPAIAVIGTGEYARSMLLPELSRQGCRLVLGVSTTGVGAWQAAKKFVLEKISTDTEAVFTHEEVNTVVVATRHNTHARFVLSALKTDKHIFVEKPLALNLEDVNNIEALYAGKIEKPCLMVGFNRRFSPLTAKVKSLLDIEKAPKCFVMTVNAGDIPADHWAHDLNEGGGRLIGEACHFIDLLRFLAGSRIIDFNASMLGQHPLVPIRHDKVSIHLNFADGSIGTIHYFANGHKSYPKENLQVFCAGKVLELDNFKSLKGYGWVGFNHMNLRHQDKGQAEMVKCFIASIEEGKLSPIPTDEIFEVAKISILLAQQVGIYASA